MSFLKLAGKRLQALLVTQSPRIDLETIEVLVKSCVNLTELRLSEIGQLKDDLIEPLGKLKKLTILDLSSAGQSLTDSAVNTLLSKVGKNLVSLNMSDNPDLTDVALLAIATHCPQLRSLHLRNLVELTDDGVADFFATLERSGHPGFETIDLEKGHDLKSRALHALIAHSRTSLEKLSLMGWREVEKEALSELTECSQLRELDLGWCRQVTDFTIKDVLDACSAIKVIKVWGELCLVLMRDEALKPSRLQPTDRRSSPEKRGQGESGSLLFFTGVSFRLRSLGSRLTPYDVLYNFRDL